MNNKYVQYGCGRSAAENWRNFDASPTLRLERLPILGKLYSKNDPIFSQYAEYGDIVKGLPISANSCEGVYCSHILEHLSLDDCRKAILNTYKILKSGGCFRIVVPDLEYSIKNYINDSSVYSAFEFMKETSLGKESRNRGLKGFVKEWFGNSQHLWMWDYKSLAQELDNAGFIDIRKAEYGDAKDALFLDVEDEDRWKNCLGIECKKA